MGNTTPRDENLTRQQAAFLREFLPVDDPHQHTDETLSTATPYRSYPTMSNLVDLGHVEREAWLGRDEGWLYSLTEKGKAYLRPDSSGGGAR